MRLRITDNNWSTIDECVTQQLTEEDKSKIKSDLEKIADKEISKLSLDDNPNLLIYPKELNHYGDEIGESCILSLRENKIFTGNIMGFVGVGDTQLEIKSRFSKNCEQDYFLHYMLQKVFSINLFDIQHTISKQHIFDFRLYLFPHFLKKAMSQGLFKKYKRFEYNNANVRGPIDVNRHVRENIPFKGTIAYSVREHSYDNEVIQLVRHTIECIRTKDLGSAILNDDLETRDCVSQIIMATPTYNVRDRIKIINQNLRPLQHPYYSAYTDLQKICLQILRHESIKYGQEKDKVYGVLFDGAWLWEEYIAKVLSEGTDFKHYTRKKSNYYLFEKDDGKSFQRIIPDYYDNVNNIVADAKYIPLHNYDKLDAEKALTVYYKTIMYMYRFNTEKGFLLHPISQDEADKFPVNVDYKIKGRDKCHLYKVGFVVPSEDDNYSSFRKIMKEKETIYQENIRQYISNFTKY